MGDIYGSGASGSVYGGTSAPAPKHHGLLHDIVRVPATFSGHLLGDVRDATVGLPQGLVLLAEHPIGSFKGIAKTTWQDWSPLFHGHVAEWGHNFMAHPLAPILDVAGLVTGGAGLAAKGGEAAASVGLLSKESKLAKLGSGSEKLTRVVKVDGAPEAFRHYDHNPAVRLRQRAQDHLGQQLSEHLPSWFGRTAQVADGAEEKTLRLGADGKVSPADLAKVVEIKRGRIQDFTDAGYAERYFKRQESYRSGATKAAVQAQVAAFVKAGEDVTKRPGETFLSIWRHGRQQLEDHAYQVDHADAKRLKNGLIFVKDRSSRDIRNLPAVNNLDDFQKAFDRFAATHTTTDITKAQRAAGGKYLVVHKRAAMAYGKEAAHSATFLSKLYKYPTQAWKYLVLATRPAYFVNNAVGNTFMTLATLGPVAFTRGLADAYRQVHGEAAAAKSLEGADRALRELHGDWQDKWYLGVHQGFGQEAMKQLHMHDRVAGHGRTAQVVKVAEQGFYPITHKVSDVFLRRVMVNALMRRHGAVQRLMQEGHSFDSAANVVSRDPAVRDRIQESVNNALGDYHHLNGVERQIRQFVPFYTWDRAIARHGVHLALDKSGRTALATHQGEAGTAHTEQVLGAIPDFLKGVITLSGHGKDGRARVLTTQGLDPYSSIPDVADTVGALVGVGNHGAAESISSQINPIITGAIESATGQSLLSGAKLPHRPGGVIGQTAANTFEGTPAVKLVETLIHGESQPKPNKRTGKTVPFLYRKDAKTQVAALLGVPVKELDKSRAHDMVDKAAGRQKKKRRSGGIY